MDKVYRNISILFTMAFAVVFVAFFKTYFSLFPTFDGTTLLVHLHAITIILWFTMLISQPLLIQRRKLAIHRIVGRASYLLVPIMIILFILMTRRHQLRERDLILFVYNTFDVMIFTIFYSLAIRYRKNVAYHARFMSLTILPFFGATIGRLPVFPIPAAVLSLLIMSALIAYEWSNRKVFKPYVISLTIFTALLLCCVMLLSFGTGILNKVWQICFDQ